MNRGDGSWIFVVIAHGDDRAHRVAHQLYGRANLEAFERPSDRSHMVLYGVLAAGRLGRVAKPEQVKGDDAVFFRIQPRDNWSPRLRASSDAV